MFAARLVAYEAAGDRIGPLPRPAAWSASFTRNAVGSLRVQYAPSNAGGEHFLRGLDQGLEVAVEVTDGGAIDWTEALSGRFVYVDRKWDQLDPARMIDATLQSYGWLLGKACDLNTAAAEPVGAANEGQRYWGGEFDPFPTTPGRIMETLLSENAARGGIPVTPNFDGTNPTFRDGGTLSPWPDLDVYYETGVDLLTILNNMVEQRACDWATEGRMLNLYNPGPYDSQINNPVALRLDRRGMIEAPQEDSIADLVSKVLVRSDDGVAEIRSDIDAPDPWGDWEGYRSQSGLSVADARALGDGELVTHGRVKGQHAFRFRVKDSDPKPLIDYVPGDFVSAPTANGPTPMIVEQITLDQGLDGLTVVVVLNDRIVEPEVRRARTLKNVVNGVAGLSSGGSSGEDTGWLDMVSIGANYTEIENMQARMIGNRGYLRGVLQNSVDTGYTIAAVLPAGVDPPAIDWAIDVASGSSTALRVGYVDSSGNLRIYSGGTSAAFMRVSGSWLND